MPPSATLPPVIVVWAGVASSESPALRRAPVTLVPARLAQRVGLAEDQLLDLGGRGLGVAGEDQGGGAGDVRRGHRGALAQLVGAVARGAAADEGDVVHVDPVGVV